jgi:hypothetical protein
MKNVMKRVDRSVNFFTLTMNTNMNNLINTLTENLAEQLKSSLVKRLSSEYAGLGRRLVHQTVNEAYALASATQVPLLLLPVLAEEKVQNVAAWSSRQRAIRYSHGHALAA